MNPWYKGYQGTIEPLQGGKSGFLVRGCYEVLDDDCTLVITELPIGKWTRDYKTMLEELADPKNGEIVDEIRELHTENRVHFIVKCHPGKLQDIEKKEGIEKKFKLATTLSSANYVLFDY